MSAVAILVDLQFSYRDKNTPAAAEITNWVKSALHKFRNNAELTVRIVDEIEATELNERWRNSKGPTNVLSFPAQDTADLVPELLGDIVICATVVEREAIQQTKSFTEHWAHMVIHGALHLLGYDHLEKQDAIKMEALEIRILAGLGYKNPYI